MPSADVGGVAADCRGQQSAVWHARREFELLTLLAHEGDEETRRLFLRLRRQKHLTPPEAKQAAAATSRLPLGHRPCLSGRRQPSSLGASETGNGSSGSTSPRWRRCARGCRRGCAAPGLTSGSLWSSRSQRRRRGRQRPHPLHRRPWLWGPSRQTLRWRPCGSAILPGGLRFASPPS